jgi:hypothetical protein
MIEYTSCRYLLAICSIILSDSQFSWPSDVSPIVPLFGYSVTKPFDSGAVGGAVLVDWSITKRLVLWSESLHAKIFSIH